MKKVILLFTLAVFVTQMHAQRSKYPTKSKEESSSMKGYDLKVNVPDNYSFERRKVSSNLNFQNSTSFAPTFEKNYLEIQKGEDSQLPIFIKKPVHSAARSNAPLTEKSMNFLQSVHKEMNIDQPAEEFILLAQRFHPKTSNYTLKYGQVYQGIPVLNAEIILHEQNQQIHMMTGRYFATPKMSSISPAFPMDKAFDIALEDVQQYTKLAREDVSKYVNFISMEDQKELVIYMDGQVAKLAWHFDFHPNLREKWNYVIDAKTGDIFKSLKNSCSLHNHEFDHSKGHSCSEHAPKAKKEKIEINADAVNGPFSGSGTDLLGITRPINGYESGGIFVLADASRPMFNAGQSNMPNQPVGSVWTLDARNTSPETNNFDYDHSRNNSSNWNDPTEVSGHYNGGEAYEYFNTVHQRNSINGSGGNIITFVNVSQRNGDSMENAYWNGSAIFYGNGGSAFQPLARSLDVAGHEMSHGVIQTTANLVYENQSGAMNESFADIFGAMIDRNDWKIGEDVVNTAFFPTGALRDMQDPNNGGNSLQDAGWQPKHMNEFQNLPNTPQGDNGGVHINSGITNHAYYRIATNIGKSNAEDIFYRALTQYLVRSSQFIDLRIAAERSAIDLFGNGSAQLAAVQQGFNEVGIGSSTGTNTGTDSQTELETNTGTDFILYSDPQQSNLFVAQTADLENASQISSTDQLSKPSITDDGTVIVFIGTDRRAHIIQIDYDQGTIDEQVLIDDPAWRNIVIAKDGSRIALVADQTAPEILVFDFAAEQARVYTLFNPTFTTGVSTGDVLFADVMEFDYAGEFLMYDANSEIAGADFGQFINYWDIGFMKVWDNNTNNFVSNDNNINKLFNQLPENTSVGNPSFAKEADFIVAFDFLDEQGDANIFAVNVETGQTSNQPIFSNSILNYPNYSIEDDALIFDANSNGVDLIGIVDMNNDRINASTGEAFILIENARWGTWYGTGQRNLTSTETLTDAFELGVFPNPVKSQLNISYTNPNGDAATVQVYNVQGSLMKSFEIEGSLSTNKHQLDVSELSSGMYLVKLLIGNEFATHKVTIIK